jgi:YHS domain-containing protein
VTGKLVDPAYQVVFKGKLVGFCCPKCPEAFWADPTKYESKLP